MEQEKQMCMKYYREDDYVDKKKLVVDRMQDELDNAHQGIVEPIAGESYMTVQFVYQMLKNSFEKTFIPEHILDIFVTQDFPLSSFYDYFHDNDLFKNDVNWDTISRDYAIYRECENVEERLHEKVKAEYKEYMKKVVDLTPYKMGPLLTEIAIKMQVFSIFRYQDCFSMEDMKLLQEVDDLLDKTFKKHDDSVIKGDDEHVLWAKAMECLGKVVEDERELDDVEDNALEA
jgi:hypothetical protein